MPEQAEAGPIAATQEPITAMPNTQPTAEAVRDGRERTRHFFGKMVFPTSPLSASRHRRPMFDAD